MSNDDPGFDKDALLAFYEQLHNNRRDYVDRMWGTVQYFTTLVTSLLTLSTGGAFVMLQYAATVPTPAAAPARLSLAFLCLIAGGLAVVGLTNLRRECENEYVQMGLILAAERVLGLQKEVPPDKRFFAEHTFLIPHLLFLPKESFPDTDPSKIVVPTIDEFVARMITKKRSFYAFFRRVFQALVALSLALSGTFAAWAFAS